VRDKLIKDSAIRLIDALGVHVGARTNYAQLRELITSLRPIDGGARLIRLGPDGDGGYLVPDDLAGIEYAFSPGVSTESGFEAELAERGVHVFLADFSVERPAQNNPRFVFDKRYVGCLSDARFITLDEWKEAKVPEYDGDLLLQMDIEGAEFETLLAASTRLLEQFRIMVIEFHYLQDLLSQRHFNLLSRLFAKLLRSHSVVHIHPNNCCGSVKSGGLELPRVAEFTFHRNDRLAQRVPSETFPHPLDRDNTRKPPLVLPECWYRRD
jgi:hypothetical protein